MEERFAPAWLTIREFEHSVPRCMYHKENDGGLSDGCTAGIGFKISMSLPGRNF